MQTSNQTPETNNQQMKPLTLSLSPLQGRGQGEGSFARPSRLKLFFSGNWLLVSGYPRSNDRGMMLVTSIILLIFTGVFGLVASSIVGTVAGGTATEGLDAKALGLAQAGHQWYLKQLDEDANWADNCSTGCPYALPAKNYGNGTFRIDVLSASEAEVQFKSTGSITSLYDTGVNVQRWMKQTVVPHAATWPAAFNYAYFNGGDNGTATVKFGYSSSPVTVTGADIWSYDNVFVELNSSVGTVHVPTGKTVSGTGSYTAITESAPYPTFPTLDNTYYTTKMSNFDTALDANTCGGIANCQNLTLAAGQTLNLGTDTTYCTACTAGITGRCCYFNTFTTSSTSSIVGTGTILANDINLHYLTANGSTLTVTPDSGKDISLVAQQHVSIGVSAVIFPPQPNFNIIRMNVNAPGHLTLYGRYSAVGIGGSGILLAGNGDTTQIWNALMLSRGGYYIMAANVYSNSIIYNPDPSGGYVYFLGQTGNGNIFEGSIISEDLFQSSGAVYLGLGYGSPASTPPPVFKGMIYSVGKVYVSSSWMIQGSIVTLNRYPRTSPTFYGGCSLSHSSSYLPSQIPPGIGGDIDEKPATWDGG